MFPKLSNMRKAESAKDSPEYVWVPGIVVRTGIDFHSSMDYHVAYCALAPTPYDLPASVQVYSDPFTREGDKVTIAVSLKSRHYSISSNETLKAQRNTFADQIDAAAPVKVA